MFPTLAGGAGEALDKALDELRARLLAAAAASTAAAAATAATASTATTAQADAPVAARPDARPAQRCHTSGASRGTNTAA